MTVAETSGLAQASSILASDTKGFEAAAGFLELLGKDPATTRLRTFVGKGAKSGWDLEKAAKWSQNGGGVYVVIGNGGDSDAEITSCPALFVEWDDGATIVEQMDRWQVLELPEPTVMVWTGGKSLHCYWVLQEPMAPAEWRPLQKRLIDYCNGDKACCNPSRVMRLPGFAYEKKPGTDARCTRLKNFSGNRYKAEDIAAALPVEVAPKPAARALEVLPGGLSGDLPPRPPGALREALNKIPPFSHDAGQRQELVNLAMRLQVEVGAAEAEKLLAETCCQGISDLSGYFNTKPTKINSGSIWPFLSETWGIDITRHDLKGQKPKTKQQQATTKTKPVAKARHMSHSRAMTCFDRCVEIQANKERNSLRRRARLLKAAKDLGLAAFINRQEIAQRVLEAKARCGGEGFQALTAADRAKMPRPVVRWLLPGLIPASDLTIIGGRPKVGKTRLAVAIAAAVLRGETLFDLPLPAQTHPVLLVTDDQSDGDSADMLAALDIWEHPKLIWSRNFRLTETDLQGLLDAIKSNPGALVVLDSLRSISRALQHGENDPEIGATLYDLKQAVIDAGGTLLLIHHCNKAADLFGTEALSGHNAIAGAANTVLTMHYLPGENGQPNKGSPERRLFREARSGEGFDLVIGRDGSTFRKVAELDQWMQQAKQTKEAGRLTNTQQEAKEALEAAPGEWMTRRQVCEAIGVEWGDRGRNKEARRVDEALRRLVELKVAESVRAGTEATYRASHEHTGQAGQPSQSVTATDLSDSTETRTSRTSRTTSHTNVSGLSGFVPDTETPCDDTLAGLSGLSGAPDHLAAQIAATRKRLAPELD